MGSLKETTYHDLRITVVRSYETPPGLVYPEFPRVMEPDPRRPDAYHTPHIEENDTENGRAVHGFVAEFKPTLNGQIAKNSHELSRPPRHHHVGQLDQIVPDNFVLESRDHGSGGIE